MSHIQTSMDGCIYILKMNNEDYLIDEKDCGFAEGSRVIKTDAPETFVLLSILRHILYHKKFVRNQKQGESLVYLVPGNSVLDAKSLYESQVETKTDNVRVVFLEEGIGDYIRADEKVPVRWLETVSPVKRLILRPLTYIEWKLGTNRMIAALDKLGQLERFYLFDRQPDGSYVPNATVCKAFSDVFYRRADENRIEVDYENTIIISTQPFMENMGCNIDLYIYSEIKRICEKKNIKLIVKPHPRERNLERYRNIGLYVDEETKSISQEILFASSDHKPVMITGFFSTSLIMANILFDIPAMGLGKMSDFIGLGKFKDDIENFTRLFKNNLLLPESIEDIEQILN